MAFVDDAILVANQEAFLSDIATEDVHGEHV
jgi:hypothetical protein